MTPTLTLRKALSDPLLLGTVLTGDSWFSWRTLLFASMGEVLTDEERELFRKLTGREHEPDRRVEEFVGVIGRRGGKSRAISVLSTYIAGLCTHPNLVRGERGVLLIIAPDQRQADIVLDYITANFEQSPILKQLIESRTARSLKLTNRIDIEVRASEFRRLRGPTYVAIIADESAFWMTENSTNPDSEILNAVRPGLATTGGPLFMISSPYARRGELWNLYDRYFGKSDDPLILVAQGSSRTFNPSLPQSVVDRAMERDQASAEAEYGGNFRRDIEAFVSIEAVRACVATGIYERMPQPGVSYVGFADPSGGSADSFTCGIAHVDFTRDVTVIDALYERKPPFSPEVVVEEISSLLKRYNVITIVGDKYASIWPVEQFSETPPVKERFPAALIFKLGNVDFEKLKTFDWVEVRNRWFEQGILPSPMLALAPCPNTNEAIVNVTYIANVDQESTEDVTRALVSLRKQISNLVPVLKKNVPGLESSFLSATAPLLGVRDARKIIGKYRLTGKDVRAMRDFEDAVTPSSWPIDVHLRDGGNIWFETDKPYMVPYQVMVPKKGGRLLVSGRSIDTDEHAFSGARVIPTCMGLGEAAGEAAAIAINRSTTFEKVDGKELHALLKAKGVQV